MRPGETTALLGPNGAGKSTSLDEPTAAMDVETRRLFWTSMKEEVAQGRTLLFATHYLEEADQAADRILVINRGRLLADGTPAEIKARAGAKRISFRLDWVDEGHRCGSTCPPPPAWCSRPRPTGRGWPRSGSPGSGPVTSSSA